MLDFSIKEYISITSISILFDTFFRLMYHAKTFIITITFCLIAMVGKKLQIKWKDRNLVVDIPQQNNNPSSINFNTQYKNKDLLSQNQNIAIFSIISVVSILISLMFFFSKDSPWWTFGFLRFFNTWILCFILPVLFLICSQEARNHVKIMFWNEWAPDFVRNMYPFQQ